MSDAAIQPDDQDGDLFPRVSARRSVPTASLIYRPAVRDDIIAHAIRQLRSTARHGSARLQRLIGADPVAWITAAGAMVIIVAAIIVVSIGVRSNAEAAPAGAGAARDMMPALRDHEVVGLDRDIGAALLKAEIAPGDVDRILAETARYARPAPGTAIDMVLAPRPQSAEYREIQAVTIRPKIDTAIDFTRTDGQLTATTRHLAVDTTPMRIVGVFGGDIRHTLAAYGVGQRAVDDYVRIIGAQMDLTEIAQGDRFDIIMEHGRASDGHEEAGRLLYAGLAQQDGGHLSMSEWTLRGKLAWYDADKAAHSIDNVQRPVQGEVSSSFGWRFHPILGYNRMHRGIDFRGGIGTPVISVQDGWTERAGWSGGYGNQVRLRHGGDIETSYSHLSRIAVAPGSYVRQGQVIGWIGMTGLATGPHLHFEVLRGGEQIDPALVAFTVGPQLRGDDLVGYERRHDALIALPVARSQPLS